MALQRAPVGRRADRARVHPGAAVVVVTLLLGMAYLLWHYAHRVRLVGRSMRPLEVEPL